MANPFDSLFHSIHHPLKNTAHTQYYMMGCPYTFIDEFKEPYPN